MSESFLITHCDTPVDANGTPFWGAQHETELVARVDTHLTDDAYENIYDAFAAQADPADDDRDYDTAVRDELLDMVREAVRDVFCRADQPLTDAATHVRVLPHGATEFTARAGDRPVILAAGASFGDDPTPAFGHVHLLNLARLFTEPFPDTAN